MKSKQIITAVKMYEQRLTEENVGKQHLDPNVTFRQASELGLVKHAHHLCNGDQESRSRWLQ